WEGVFIPVVPNKLLDVLECPVPALVGVQSPFDPVDYPGVVVLDLDAGSTLTQFHMGGMKEKVQVPEVLQHALEATNILQGRGR
ncbi:unnamed protein product, partial [Choristocarpus tenellus]